LRFVSGCSWFDAVQACGLKRQAFKQYLAFATLGWLSGCTTLMPPPTTTVPEPVASVVNSAPVALLPTRPGLTDALTAAPSYKLIDDLPFDALDTVRPTLLAGQPARELERGGASWYGPGFHGRRTASGERYDMNALTAAHRTLPFGTWVRVRSLVNGREVDVRITDRGPFIRSRVIDVSRGAAEALGMLGLGFKEVVLLVPESTIDVVETSLPVVKGRNRVIRRVLKAQ
jgi:rare lipoprotein A